MPKVTLGAVLLLAGLSASLVACHPLPPLPEGVIEQAEPGQSVSMSDVEFSILDLHWADTYAVKEGYEAPQISPDEHFLMATVRVKNNSQETFHPIRYTYMYALADNANKIGTEPRNIVAGNPSVDPVDDLKPGASVDMLVPFKIAKSDHVHAIGFDATWFNQNASVEIKVENSEALPTTSQ
ncbi:MAG: hypothetical protein Q3962_08995 [Corynebacterium sp.]|nr:hypothetical protein [Corynebacterium sp.]